MKRIPRLSMLFAAGVVIAGAQMSIFREPVGRPANMKDRQLDGVGVDQKLNAQIPLDLEFKDEQGRIVRLREYFGKKPVVLAPVYYQCPMLCTQILNGLVSSLKAVSFVSGDDFEVVAVSFDPTDTPELANKKKASYAGRFGKKGVEQGWHFLTGQESNIKALLQSIGYRYKFVPETKQFAHPGAIVVATPGGSISRYLYGVEYEPRDMRLALVEASQGRIGTPVDSLLLFCYHYDPATGKYSAAAMNLIRLLGLATVAALGSFLWISARRPPAQKTA